MQNDTIMKYTKNMLETSTSPMDNALAPAPGSAPAHVSAHDCALFLHLRMRVRPSLQ